MVRGGAWVRGKEGSSGRVFGMTSGRGEAKRFGSARGLH